MHVYHTHKVQEQYHIYWQLFTVVQYVGCVDEFEQRK